LTVLTEFYTHSSSTNQENISAVFTNESHVSLSLQAESPQSSTTWITPLTNWLSGCNYQLPFHVCPRSMTNQLIALYHDGSHYIPQTLTE